MSDTSLPRATPQDLAEQIVREGVHPEPVGTDLSVDFSDEGEEPHDGSGPYDGPGAVTDPFVTCHHTIEEGCTGHGDF